MAIRYIDANRGDDSNSGASSALPWRTLAKAYNFSPGAGGGLYLASDSVFEINPTKTAHNAIIQTQFNGGDGNPAFLTSYDPVANTTGQKPTIQYRMFPQVSDWQWDAADNFGYPKGWYIQFDWIVLSNDVLVKVGGEFVPTTNQSSPGNQGYGSINGDYEGAYQGQFVNGMSRDTLRFNIDLSGIDVGGIVKSRLYLSGFGLLDHNAGHDPSSVFGPGQIMLGLRSAFYFYNSSNYVDLSNIHCQDGGGLVTFDGLGDRVTQGAVVRDCSFYNTQTPVNIIQATGNPSTTKIAFDIHDNVSDLTSGPALTAYKIGIAGYYRNNELSRGNRCSSMGGGAYIQSTVSTVGGARDPFVVCSNIADDWKNGTGNNSFDGSCYYAEIRDTGTIFKNNIAKNSYVAFQCGSGSRSECYGNIVLNCEKFGMWNNPTSPQASDYFIAHNLFIGAAQGTFGHGQDTESSPSVAVITHSGDIANSVGFTFVNNCLVLPGGDDRIGLNVLTSAAWTLGKATVMTNVVVCDSAMKIGCDIGTVDKTVASSTLAIPRDGCRFVDADYHIDAGSALFAAGVDLIGEQFDFNSVRYYSPPSIGPHEVQRRSDWFGNF